jgi:hypothetical protein
MVTITLTDQQTDLLAKVLRTHDGYLGGRHSATDEETEEIEKIRRQLTPAATPSVS